MKLDKAAAAVAAAVALVALGGALVLISRYMPGANLWLVFLNAFGPALLSMWLSVLLVAVVTVLALVRAPRVVFRLLAALAAVASLFGALFGLLATQAASAQVGGVSLEVRAPGDVEGLLCLCLGFAAAAAALVAGLVAGRTPVPSA